MCIVISNFSNHSYRKIMFDFTARPHYICIAQQQYGLNLDGSVFVPCNFVFYAFKAILLGPTAQYTIIFILDNIQNFTNQSRTVLRAIFNAKLHHCSIAKILTVITFGSLPSKCISLILTGYNFMDCSSPLLFSYCFCKY